MSWVQTVLGTARRLGADERTLLARAGIDAAELDLERWPVDHITRLWRAAAAHTQDAAFGLKTGTQVGPASFNVVSAILQSCASLREAIGVAQKYQRLISDGGRLQLLAGTQTSWLIYHPCQGDLAFSAHQIEAVLAALVAFSSWVSERPMRPLRVQFSHARMGPLAAYRDVFGCPIEFEQAYNGLLLDNALLDKALPQADARIARLNERHAAAKLHALSHSANLLQALQAWVSAHLGPPLPTRAQAAAAFGLGERTLARKLRTEGTSFIDLVDGARRAQALEQTELGTDSFSDIAQTLGFAGLSPFYRAFKRWTGTSPARWRARRAKARARRRRSGR